MAVFHGKNGKVMWDSSTEEEVELEFCTSWSVDVTADVAEATDMGDTWKSYVAGFNDWTATVECNIDSGGSDVPIATGSQEALGEETPAKLELWLDETAGSIKVLYGSAICTSIGVSTDANDVVKVTYNFQGVAVLAWGTADPSYA